MTLVTQAILKTQTDLIDILIITVSSIITDSKHAHFPRVSTNTIFGLSDLTFTPTLTLMFVSSQDAKAVSLVVANACVHVRRYELKI